MDTGPRQQIMTLIAIALTFASGAMDLAGFTRLGTVFTSVVTGNIVLFGLAVTKGPLSLAGHTAVAVAGYSAGVAVGTLIAYRVRAARAGKAPGADAGRSRAVSPDIRWALAAELVLMAGFAVGWEISEGSPAGWAQSCLLAAAAAAMGVQSSAVKDMGLSDVSTTYLTGTLTGLVSSLVQPDQDTPHGLRRFGVLIGLALGAIGSGLLVAHAARAVPALPLAALILALVLASRRTWGRARGRGAG
jgi:uncharacterized membrane protein YoaK (UPF0700 family)